MFEKKNNNNKRTYTVPIVIKNNIKCSHPTKKNININIKFFYYNRYTFSTLNMFCHAYNTCPPCPANLKLLYYSLSFISLCKSESPLLVYRPQTKIYAKVRDCASLTLRVWATRGKLHVWVSSLGLGYDPAIAVAISLVRNGTEGGGGGGGHPGRLFIVGWAGSAAGAMKIIDVL